MNARTCARCGASIPPEQYLCPRCRDELPIERPVPVPEWASPRGASAGPPGPGTARVPTRRAQRRGLAVGSVAVGVALALVVVSLVSSAPGPFEATTLGVRQGSLAGAPRVVANVRNAGSQAGRARCSVTWTAPDGSVHTGPAATTVAIPPNAARRIALPVPGRAGPADRLSISCAP